MSYLKDPDFQEMLLGMIVKDRLFLRHHAHLLSDEDFKPIDGDVASRDRWVVATKALEYWSKYKEPVGALLTAELKTHIKDARLGEKRSLNLLEMGRRIVKRKLNGVQAITEKVREFKEQALLSSSIDEMVSLHGAGDLTHEKFLELARKVVEVDDSKKTEINDYFECLEYRIERRRLTGGDERYPVLFIDPLDMITRGIAKGHLGCIVAPYKRGKSLMLIWIAIAYVIQKMNVLYITLEDPKTDVEDRFDAAVANLPIKNLVDKPKTLRSRFAKFKRIVRGRLRIVDGCDMGLTVDDIDAIWQEEREKGFTADAVIVDYDDEIKAKKKGQDRRFEFAEIYRDMRRLAAKRHLLFWTAAQTQRKTEDLKIVGGDQLAEDISKARKVACMISIGKGDWGPDSLYLHIAAHKFDRQHIGCTIYSCKENMLIYDRAKTLAKVKELAAKAPKKARP
jgi:hypothetical protein